MIALCDRCLASVPVVGGVVDEHLCRRERRMDGYRPTLGQILAQRSGVARVRLAAERARMWGA